MLDHALPALSPETARRLIQRIETIPLFAHAYSFHQNFRFGHFKPDDLLDFATEHGLCGVKIHIADGEDASLGNMDDAGLQDFGLRARHLGLGVHLEISETAVPSLREAIRVGRKIGATSIRCYPRYSGKLSSVIAQTISDLKQLRELDPDGQFRFTLEQHEDLTSTEIVRIVEAVGNPNLSVMFDFSNMINAYEKPLEACAVMSAHITDVHIKDARIIEVNGGWAQIGCRSGEGDIPQARLLLELLCLGADLPQIVAFGLEEEVGYYASPFRFPGEPDDPDIQYREFSETDPGADCDLTAQLETERADAERLCAHVKRLLEQLRDHATSYL